MITKNDRFELDRVASKIAKELEHELAHNTSKGVQVLAMIRVLSSLLGSQHRETMTEDEALARTAKAFRDLCRSGDVVVGAAAAFDSSNANPYPPAEVIDQAVGGVWRAIREAEGAPAETATAIVQLLAGLVCVGYSGDRAKLGAWILYELDKDVTERRRVISTLDRLRGAS